MPARTIDSIRLDMIDVENPVGAPVLCLHGMFAGSWVFENLLPLIAQRGYPAAALSFRGHPRNPPLDSIGSASVTDYAEDATAAARALDRPIVIGHSMGGLVAMLLAGRNLARAVILVSPAPPRGITVLSPQLLLRMWRYLPAMLFSRPFLPTDADLDALVLNCVPAHRRDAIRARFVADSGRAARQMAIGIFKVPPRAVRAPMLVVGAERDEFIPFRVAQRVALTFDAPLILARRHGHFLFAEDNWQDTATEILDWIDALPRVIRDPSAEPRLRPSWAEPDAPVSGESQGQ
jgi:pimeloyl-ACP methyl ester carboxylesterase